MRATWYKSTALYLGITLASSFVGVFIYVAYDAVTNPIRINFPPDWLKEENTIFAADATIGWTLKPHASAHLMSPRQDVYTDSLTARIDEAAAAKGGVGPSSADLVVVGCSQTQGQGVPSEKTYTSLLGKMLNMSAENFGVPSYGGIQSLLALERHADLHPKIIVYGFLEDHLRRNVFPCAEMANPYCVGRPYMTEASFPNIDSTNVNLLNRDLAWIYFRQTTTTTDEYRTFFTDMYWSWRRLMGKVDFTMRLATGAGASDAFKQKVAFFTMDRMKKSAAAVGAKLIVVWLPEKYVKTPLKGAPSEISEYARSHAISFIDMTPRFAQILDSGTSLSVINDGHLNEAAHQAVAEEVFRLLSRQTQP